MNATGNLLAGGVVSEGADPRRLVDLLFSPVFFSTTLDKWGPEHFLKPHEDSRHARGRAA
jgi:hypothetical protein